MTGIMRTFAELEAGLESVRAAPSDGGAIEMIVRRPARGEREVLEAAELDVTHGLVGDTWPARTSRHTADGSPNPEQQLTLMSARAIAAIAPRELWPLAGDQLFVDLDLSTTNLPPGTRLAVGAAVIEISAVPHTGCAKFTERFGSDATKWVNGTLGRELHLRGINARIITGGTIRRGDHIRKL